MGVEFIDKEDIMEDIFERGVLFEVSDDDDDNGGGVNEDVCVLLT